MKKQKRDVMKAFFFVHALTNSGQSEYFFSCFIETLTNLIIKV